MFWGKNGLDVCVFGEAVDWVVLQKTSPRPWINRRGKASFEGRETRA